MVILSKPSVSSRVYFEDHDKVRKVRAKIISSLKALLSFEEVQEEEMCDVKVALCPIASRAGTDITAALSRLTADKPVIMMVLHHTFDRQATVPNSSVYNRDNLLLVDVLFHEDDGLLACSRNEEALSDVAAHIKQGDPRTPPASSGFTVRSSLVLLKCAMKRPDLWTVCTAVPLHRLVFQKRQKDVDQSRKFLNSIKQDWLVWMACLLIALHDEEPYRDVLRPAVLPKAFQKYLPSCYLQHWPLWAACLAATLYTARFRKIQTSLRRHWFLWAVSTAVTLYSRARPLTKP